MEIHFREAGFEDCDLIYSWANDKTVRENSFNTSQIAYKDHVDWYKNKMNSSDSFLFICYDGETPIGQVRIDKEEDNGIINYMIDKNFRGMGYGTEFLKRIIDEIKKHTSISKLIGRTKYENISSQRAFEKAGYQAEKLKDYIEYHINI